MAGVRFLRHSERVQNTL